MMVHAGDKERNVCSNDPPTRPTLQMAGITVKRLRTLADT